MASGSNSCVILRIIRDRSGAGRLTPPLPGVTSNAAKPEALRVKLRREDGKYIGYFGEGGPRSSLDGPDRPGPILLQGDHGPVAYRNLYIRRLDQ
ncbi:MAG: hypothetical protein ACLQU5_12090 [Isosphaeraceae bacterium]